MSEDSQAAAWRIVTQRITMILQRIQRLEDCLTYSNYVMAWQCLKSVLRSLPSDVRHDKRIKEIKKVVEKIRKQIIIANMNEKVEFYQEQNRRRIIRRYAGFLEVASETVQEVFEERHLRLYEKSLFFPSGEKRSGEIRHEGFPELLSSEVE